MNREEGLIVEINRLWEPVYPYMAAYLLAASGRSGGALLDLGPFAGGIAPAAAARAPGLRCVVRDEGPEVLAWARDLAERAGVADRVSLVRAGPDLSDVADAAYDLVAVRGAFFFLDADLLAAVGRVLRPGGLGWVGGGYGPLTPAGVIGPIADRSRELNARLGKRRVSEGEAAALVRAAGLEGRARVSADGGLWIEVHG